jgi:hypothetical protein
MYSNNFIKAQTRGTVPSIPGFSFRFENNDSEGWIFSVMWMGILASDICHITSHPRSNKIYSFLLMLSLVFNAMAGKQRKCVLMKVCTLYSLYFPRNKKAKAKTFCASTALLNHYNIVDLRAKNIKRP